VQRSTAGILGYSHFAGKKSSAILPPKKKIKKMQRFPSHAFLPPKKQDQEKRNAFHPDMQIGPINRTWCCTSGLTCLTTPAAAMSRSGM
jgi:hypothetical protein